jgi:hypothetical protein
VVVAIAAVRETAFREFHLDAVCARTRVQDLAVGPLHCQAIHGYLPRNLNSVLTFPAFVNTKISVVVIRVVVTDAVVSAEQ